MSSATDRADVDERLDAIRDEIEDVLDGELDDGERLRLTDEISIDRTGDEVSIVDSSGSPLSTDASTAYLLANALEVVVDPRWS
jgi:hypothetical protein